jgi:hypothetical protein
MAMICGIPKTAFNNTDLKGLQAVFDEVCMTLESERGQINKETTEAIQRRLFLLACNGVNDARKLRERLLRSFTDTRRLRVSRVERAP